MNEFQFSPEVALQLVKEMEELCHTGFIDGKGGIPLYYAAAHRSISSSDKALVLVTGRNESVYKYAELFHDLKGDAVVFAYDHRGQGRSGRMLDDPLKGYVDDFTDYAADLKTFLKRVVRPERFQRTIVVAHSMGGAVAALALASDSVGIDGLVLSSPMVDINTGLLPRPFARWMARLLDRFGFGSSYILGGGYRVLEFTEDNNLTSSRPRYLYGQHIVQSFPEIALGDPTNRWLHQAFGVRDTLMASAATVTVPVLLLQAGKDTVVDLVAQTRFCALLPNCRIERFASSRHDIFMEKDSVRGQALTLVRKFLQG